MSKCNMNKHKTKISVYVSVSRAFPLFVKVLGDQIN